MIPSPFRVVEITLYSMLTFLPFVVMIFYPAREKLRFRPIVTGIFIFLLALAHLASDVVIALELYPNADLVILAGFLFHGLIYLLMFRQSIGRTLFAWLAVTNLAVLVTTAAKWLEGLLFPGMVNEVFGLSYLFLLLVVEAVFMGPSLLLVKKFGLVFRFQKLHWNIAWILPAICTAFWYIYMYMGFSFTDTWITIRPANTLFLLVTNLLFALICFKPTTQNNEEAVVDEALEAAKAEEKAKLDAERAEAKARRAAERAEAKAKREAERAEAKAKREAEKAEKAAAKAAAQAAEAAAAEEAQPAESSETPVEETAEAAPSEAPAAEPAPAEVPAAEPTESAPAAEPAEEEIETVIVEAPEEEAPAEVPAEEITEEAPAETPADVSAEAPVEETAEAPAPVPTVDSQEYLLRVQTVQHVNMLEKMTEARRVNQNLQLQLNMMEDSLAQNDYRKLREQLRTFQTFIPAARSKPFCENATIDNLLQYYAQTANNYGTVFNADVRVPASIAVRGRDLTVLLGNLLDNAIDACRSQKSFDRKIRIRGGISGDSLRFVIGNTYETPVVRDEDGTFHSTKHSGSGIGTEIVKEIVQRYNGTLEYDITEKHCKVSVTLNP